MRMENIATTGDADFAVVGLTFDICASYRVGTRLGSTAIRAICSSWRRSPTAVWRVVLGCIEESFNL